MARWFDDFEGLSMRLLPVPIILVVVIVCIVGYIIARRDIGKK